MHLHIRYVQPDDLQAVHDLFTSAHVINGTMRIPYQSPAYTAKRLEHEEGVIKLFACAAERVVGYAELITHPDAPRHRHAGEINLISVRADRQGQGIGRTLMSALLDLAANWLQLSRVSLVVWRSNTAAIKLYERCGFQIESTLRRFVFREDAYEDAYTMAWIRDDAGRAA